MNPVKAVQQHRQAIWLDFLARNFIHNGELATLIRQDGVLGVTSNPSIFEKAIAGSSEYDEAIQLMLNREDRSVVDLYEHLAIEDIRHAADALLPSFQATNGVDGFVSLEVSPYLAMDTAASVAEGVRLWKMIRRNNAMIKIPATTAGIPAIGSLLSQGINVNVTLLFSRRVYREVAETYISALEDFAKRGGDISTVSSVASFFVSRIDVSVEALLETASTFNPDINIDNLKGKIAIANARLAYNDYKTLFSGARWKKLADKGAKPQRLLWASTGTKNKAFSDVLYLEELIGPDTVNTVPPATLDAFRDHGKVRSSLEENIDEAQRVLNELSYTGIALENVTERLVADGVALFSDAADSLLGAVAAKRMNILGNRLNGQLFMFPPELSREVQQCTDKWRTGGLVRRMWGQDATLWTGADEDRWLGWLDSVEKELASVNGYRIFANKLRDEGIRHVVVLGMGGSSIGAEALAAIFGNRPNWPELLILDSTDPAQINTIDTTIVPSTTLFIVSSKSGSTIEPNMLMDFFFDKLSKIFGTNKAGRHFVAITDPGSQLEKIAERNGFRQIFFGEPSIGGRYSVLSPFGMAPAAAAGFDIAQMLESTLTMVRSCGADVPPAQNPGVLLGISMATAAHAGRDKVTIVSSAPLKAFGAWAEQLIAESTGKNGKALIPVDSEPLGSPSVYSADRFFIHLSDGNDDVEISNRLKAIREAGHPVVRITVPSPKQIGQEFFRFEIATAVAGAILGINPFDQPDVEASKIRTRELMLEFERTGSLPSGAPLVTLDGIELYADVNNATELRRLGANGTIESWLRAHFSRTLPGDYLGLLAYIERNTTTTNTLQGIRVALRDKLHAATCVGFGPRFLHSTGQAYKGGPNNGVFLQITAADTVDLPIPKHEGSFGVIKAAQASADFDVLARRSRRALRIHLKDETAKGLAKLHGAITRALS